jgi:hypothetical protein
MPFCSSVTGANRKSSNSDARRETGEELVIPITEFCRHLSKRWSRQCSARHRCRIH